MNDQASTAQHYESEGLLERLKRALPAIETHPDKLDLKALAALDQFHSRGLEATVELARLLPLNESTRVLDIGSGLGGPSRYLAHEYGCTVNGIDLSAAFVEAATYLAQRTGLSDKVTYERADALHLPFPDETFDVAWTQHVAMNIGDRAALYRGASRVLHPGGWFAFFDVLSTSDTPLHYPVPWARGPEASFLVTPDRMRELMLEQGFKEVSWLDSTQAAIEWFAARRQEQAQQATRPALGLQLAMGPGFGEMSANFVRNLREGRAVLIQAIYRKG